MDWFTRRILVIGTGARALHLRNLMSEASQKLANDLIFAPESVIGGACGSARDILREAIIPVGTETIEALARGQVVDEIVVAPDEGVGISLECLLACKTSGIPVTDYNTFIERETGRVDLTRLEVSWLVYSKGFRRRGVDMFLKALVDISLSCVFLLLCLPVMLAVMIAIALESRGPVIYSQKRVAQNGRAFSLYKLRTMYVDAEQHGPRWADKNDPRVTRVGKFLRRTRIDEIPQLLNVLCGDMSLVGPRPERPVFVEKFSEEIALYDLRHSVKPGLTGWAQINYPYGASATDAERKLEYDLYYIKNFSIVRDVAIILQTMRILLWPLGVR